MRTTDLFILYDVGEEIYPGFHVGDRISVNGNESWVGNIKDFADGSGGRGVFVHVYEDPNVYKRLRKPLHGGWTRAEDRLELVECMHPEPPSLQEIADLFGVPLDAVPAKPRRRKKLVTS